MKLLLISDYRDPHSDLVRATVENQGVEFKELQLGLPADSYNFSRSVTDPIVEVNGAQVSREDVDSSTVLFLKFAVNRPRFAQPCGDDFRLREVDALLRNALRIWEYGSARRWLIGHKNLDLQDAKPFVLRVAEQEGALIPPHRLASQDLPADIVPDTWVAKAINAWQEIRPGLYFSTRLLDQGVLDALANNSLEGPLFLQRLVAHEYEMRLYVCGTQAFAVGLSRDGSSVVDFRLVDLNPERLSLVSPPVGAVEVARRIMSRLGLQFCVFDLTKDEQGNWIFFDINSLGSWDYLDIHLSGSLSAIILRGAETL